MIEVVKGLLNTQSTESIVVPCSCHPQIPPQNQIALEIFNSAGHGPFEELVRVGNLQPGNAILTSSGSLHFKGLIHVADSDKFGKSSEVIVGNAVDSALKLVEKYNFWSIAFPVLGTPSLQECDAVAQILRTIYEARFMGSVVIVTPLK